MTSVLALLYFSDGEQLFGQETKKKNGIQTLLNFLEQTLCLQKSMTPHCNHQKEIHYLKP